VNPPQEIFVTSAGSGADRQLTKLGLRPTGMQWSKDGTTILFTADSMYRNELSYGRTEIWTVTVADGQLHRLTANTDFGCNGARYSPDGRWILATRGMADDAIIAKKINHGGATDLVLLPAAGGREINLTADWDYLPTAPYWSDDSRYIYFTGGVGGTTHLFRAPAAGGPVEQITKGERRLGGFSYDRTHSKMAYTVGLMETPTEIYVANIDGTGEKQLTRISDEFLRDVELSKVERLQFKSLDGTPVEGWLVFPQGYRADRGPYPLIVASHGGPHSADGYGFNFKNQYLGANGYFVLFVNFRSSTGYGEKFLWGTWGAWGTKDGQDVMAGVDLVQAKYPIDKRRTGAMGHSYGGFMTNWLITHYADRFAAAIPGAGIANWTSDYGNSDIPITKEKEFWGGPWDPRALEAMIRQSPLMAANKVKAATLFIIGEVDQRVPYSETQQMYVAIKKTGTPAKVIQYAGMPHGISGNWNSVHRMLNERRWMDMYLKPNGKPSANHQ
jgi:dipeptidyl aminopeptidase/acylaminoacyl peptidase